MMGVMEVVVIICGGSLALLAMIAVGYLFLQKRRDS
jgi:hypothetical protein